jgi:hypothetical protein
VRPAAAAVGKDARELDSAVEAEAAVLEDVDPVRLVVGGGVDNGDLSSVSYAKVYQGERDTHIAALDKVASDEQVLLVGRDLDVVRSDDGLVLLGVIKTLDVVEVRDVEGRDMVALCDCEVGELAVVADVRVDGDVVLGLGAQIPEELGDTLVAVGVGAEGVDDPNLAEGDSAGAC